MKADSIPGVPSQKNGKFHDTTSELQCNTIIEAQKKFDLLQNRLLDVNLWSDFFNQTTTFTLTDSDGQLVHRKTQKGDYIKINIPGPKNFLGDGFDWVNVIEIDAKNYDNDQRLLMKCVPCANPETQSNETAHFYTDQASSSFLVTRNNLKLTAEIHGRNEVWNINSGTVINRIRNGLIAGAAVIGIAKIQWKLLANKLINFNNTDDE